LKKYFKIILVLGLAIFLLLQFYQPARNKSYEQELALSFTKSYIVPKNIESILSISCYDCHSNNTNYRWYDLIQPARILVEMHIRDAKENLNFDEWGSYSKRKQESKLGRIVKQLKVNEMPLPSYTLFHNNANLSVDQKKELMDWISKIE
jgi:hypothetical protein